MVAKAKQTEARAKANVAREAEAAPVSGTSQARVSDSDSDEDVPRLGDDCCRMIGIFPADQVADDVDLINCKKLFPEMADAMRFWESCRKRGVDWREASRYMFARRKHLEISVEDVILEVFVGQCACVENHMCLPVLRGERLRRCFECLKFVSQL